MGRKQSVIPVNVINTTSTTKCMICLDDCILKNVVKHSLCSAVICKDCIQKTPDKLLTRCIYCRRNTLEFYNKKYENNMTENIREFLSNNNNHNNININLNSFGEVSPPIQININDRNIRRSNRRRMSIRGINIDHLFQEKNCWDYVVDFLMCICRMRTINYIVMFTLLNVIILVCGLMVLVIFTTEVDDEIKLWVIYVTGLVTMAILYFCVSCCMFISSNGRPPVIRNGVRISNGNLFD